MKAIVLRELGGPEKLQFEEVERPSPDPGKVVVRLTYAALNRRDVWITYGRYPDIQLPAVLGSDGAGEVIEIGDGVSEIYTGMPVVIYPGLNWGSNPYYQSKDFSVIGMPSAGTFSEYIAVPSENIVPKPNYLSFQEAAAIPVAGLTAFRALFIKGQVKRGEQVFIPGIGGGVAAFALQFAAAAGANVFVSSGSDEKLEWAKRHGAAGGVNYKNEGWVKDLSKQMGKADLIVDGVGGPTFNEFFRLIRPGGRIVSFGATAGPVPEVVLPKIFFNQLHIMGTSMGSLHDFEHMMSFMEQHQIHPVIDRCFPLESAIEAFSVMERGEHFGKIILEIPK